MWHVHNEYGAPIAECYCENSAADFRRWLRDRYRTLHALNELTSRNILTRAVVPLKTQDGLVIFVLTTVSHEMHHALLLTRHQLPQTPYCGWPHAFQRDNTV